jgi:ATP-binding cassette subfamily F protein 3
LIEAINDYAGAVILVSHDRHLIDACADRLWLVAEGRVTPFDGTLDDYQRLVLSERGSDRPRPERPATPRPARVELRRAAAEKRVATASLRRRMADAEAEVGRLTREIERLDAALAEDDLFSRNPAEAAALAKARALNAAALEQAEEDWLAAGAELQAAMD